jgi:hypothetical protein
MIFNLGATAADDDWIRAACLKEQGKPEELKKIQETHVYRLIEDDENDDDNSKS